VYGYAQSIFQFCNYFLAQKVDLSCLKIKAVILTGEMVFPQQIEVIKQVFSCPVTQEYGCTELGLIGFGCREGTMHLMENLLVETLPAENGENSGEIVVSELYGKLFPFIRYRIGDRGRISSRVCSCGRGLQVLEQLAGRKDDFIKSSDGKLIDAYLVEYIINDMPAHFGKIHKFKIVQTEYVLLNIYLIADGDNDRISSYLTNKLKLIFSHDMRVDVFFKDILPIELSGKNKCFISRLDNCNNINTLEKVI